MEKKTSNKTKIVKETLQFLDDKLNALIGMEVGQMVLACRKDSDIREMRVMIANLLLKNNGGEDAEWFSGMFWAQGEGRTDAVDKKGRINPLLDPQVREDMDDDDRTLCAFYLDLAGLCHDLYYHYLFGLDLVGNKLEQDSEGDWICDFQITNKEFVKWLKKCRCEYVAAHAAHIMVNQNLLLISGTNDVLQKFLTKTETPLFRAFREGTMEPREYIDSVIKMMIVWLRHDEEADRLNLSDDELAIYDLLALKISSGSFTEDYVDAARDLAAFFQNARLKQELTCDMYTEAFSQLMDDVMERFEITLEQESDAYLADFCQRKYVES